MRLSTTANGAGSYVELATSSALDTHTCSVSVGVPIMVVPEHLNTASPLTVSDACAKQNEPMV